MSTEPVPTTIEQLHDLVVEVSDDLFAEITKLKGRVEKLEEKLKYMDLVEDTEPTA